MTHVHAEAAKSIKNAAVLTSKIKYDRKERPDFDISSELGLLAFLVIFSCYKNLYIQQSLVLVLHIYGTFVDSTFRIL